MFTCCKLYQQKHWNSVWNSVMHPGLECERRRVELGKDVVRTAEFVGASASPICLALVTTHNVQREL